MAKTTKKQNSSTAEDGMSGVQFTGLCWLTSDGRKFNTQLKAERHQQALDSAVLPVGDVAETDEQQQLNNN
jgi:hypothetical protein